MNDNNNMNNNQDPNAAAPMADMNQPIPAAGDNLMPAAPMADMPATADVAGSMPSGDSPMPAAPMMPASMDMTTDSSVAVDPTAMPAVDNPMPAAPMMPAESTTEPTMMASEDATTPAQ